jgi:hypothetical protein
MNLLLSGSRLSVDRGGCSQGNQGEKNSPHVISPRYGTTSRPMITHELGLNRRRDYETQTKETIPPSYIIGSLSVAAARWSLTAAVPTNV